MLLTHIINQLFYEKDFPFNWFLGVLTEHLSDDHPPVLPCDGSPSVPFIGVLDEGVALVDRAAHDLPVLGEDGLDIRLGDQQGVEVADEDSGVQGVGISLVGHIAARHQAGRGGRRGPPGKRL